MPFDRATASHGTGRPVLSAIHGPKRRRSAGASRVAQPETHRRTTSNRTPTTMTVVVCMCALLSVAAQRRIPVGEQTTGIVSPDPDVESPMPRHVRNGRRAQMKLVAKELRLRVHDFVLRWIPGRGVESWRDLLRTQITQEHSLKVLDADEAVSPVRCGDVSRSSGRSGSSVGSPSSARFGAWTPIAPAGLETQGSF